MVSVLEATRRGTLPLSLIASVRVISSVGSEIVHFRDIALIDADNAENLHVGRVVVVAVQDALEEDVVPYGVRNTFTRCTMSCFCSVNSCHSLSLSPCGHNRILCCTAKDICVLTLSVSRKTFLLASSSWSVSVCFDTAPHVEMTIALLFFVRRTITPCTRTLFLTKLCA